MIWISGNLDRPVIVREYLNKCVFGLRQLVDDGSLLEEDFPLLAYRLYMRYQDMDIEAMAVLAESWFLSDSACTELLRKNCDKRLGALGQMICLASEASGLSKNPPVKRKESHKFAFLTNVSGQRFESSLVTFGYTHARACTNAVKILTRHLVETEDPSVLAVASGVAEDATGHWITDLRRSGADRNCTVLNMDGSYTFENGQDFVIYTV